jgi:hypothetical protein
MARPKANDFPKYMVADKERGGFLVRHPVTNKVARFKEESDARTAASVLGGISVLDEGVKILHQRHADYQAKLAAGIKELGQRALVEPYECKDTAQLKKMSAVERFVEQSEVCEYIKHQQFVLEIVTKNIRDASKVNTRLNQLAMDDYYGPRARREKRQ